MSCGRRERSVALWISNDLPARRAARLEAHLASCNGCRALAERLRASREEFSALADAALDGETLGAVRREVLSRVRDGGLQAAVTKGRRAVRLRWAAATAVAILVIAFAGEVGFRRAKPADGVAAQAGRATASPAPGTVTQTPPTPSAPSVMTAEVPARVPALEAPPAPGTRSRHAQKPAAALALERVVAAEEQPPVIKLLTDDPDVVIYLVADETKG
jgi:hypothetical protein